MEKAALMMRAGSCVDESDDVGCLPREEADENVPATPNRRRTMIDRPHISRARAFAAGMR